MIKHILNIIVATVMISSLSGCGRNLAADTYTSDSTLNITLRGKLIAKREVKIKEHDKLGNNSTGALLGGLGGGALGATNRNAAVIVGGAVIGTIAGATIESALGTSRGTEYIVEIDRSSLHGDYYEGSRLLRNAIAAVRATGVVTIIQAQEGKKGPIMNEGQNVLVILSEKRSRLIPSPY